MNKICLVTHVSDADGAFPILLARSVFQEIDVYSCEVREVDETLNQIFLHLDDYEKIYVVDLCMSEEMAEKINEDENIKQRIQVFDHHASRLSLNRYSFISVIDEQNGRKECGTTLFYQHLKSISSLEVLDKPVIKTMIEFVRQGDTYDFTEETKKIGFSVWFFVCYIWTRTLYRTFLRLCFKSL